MRARQKAIHPPMQMPKNNEHKKVTDTRQFISTREADTHVPASSLYPAFDIEKELLNRGFGLIAGIDEAGRGSLSGPLAVGVVIYDINFILTPHESIYGRVQDSKKLPSKKRESLYDIIKTRSLVAEALLASHRIVDRMNVNRATEYLISAFLEKTPIMPDVLLIDGNFSFKFPVASFSIRRGDSRSITIASASIIAKVYRDSIMKKMDPLYPGFDFSANKGYGTKKHMDAIKKNGCSPIHRMSYEPMKSMMNDSGVEFSNEN